ncbi:MAG: ABC transporter permease, partial [Alphaproteobacteria bacterium]
MNLILHIALTHLRGRLRQTVISVIGVATGVAFFTAMSSLLQGSQQDLVDKIIDATPHVLVSDEFRAPPPQPAEIRFADAAVMLAGQKPETELRGIRNPHGRLAEIEAMPGVTAAPLLRGPLVLRHGGKDESGVLVGIEPERFRHVSDLEDDMRQGVLDDLYTASNGVIIGSGMSEALSANLGDTLTATAPAGNTMLLTVVGIFHTGVAAADDSEVYTLLKRAQVLQGRPNVVNQIRLRLEDVHRAKAVAETVERRHGYRAVSWEEANEQILELFVVRNAIMYTVVSAILVVAGFGIFNVISTITYEKARDIAILKSLGFEERDITRVFLVQGLAVGICGAILG